MNYSFKKSAIIFLLIGIFPYVVSASADSTDKMKETATGTAIADTSKPAVGKRDSSATVSAILNDTVASINSKVDTLDTAALKQPDTLKTEVSDSIKEKISKTGKAQTAEEKFPSEEEKITVFGGAAPDYRSPRKAMFYSFLVPGSGQYYARSKVKAVVFASIEVACFTIQYRFNKNGDDRYKEFTDYVDNHYNTDNYKAWYDWVWPDVDNQKPGIDTSLIIHHDSLYQAMKSYDRQQFYEMVTKYDQFVYGWDDAQPDFDKFKNALLTQTEELDSINGNPAINLKDYRVYLYNKHKGEYDTTFGYSDRQLVAAGKSATANSEYRKADNMWFVVLVNHICSGIDAALTARRYNRAQLKQETSFLDRLHIENQMFAGVDGPVPVVTFKIDF